MTAADGVPTLAPGACLLHIGLPKTGTTAVQAAAHALRTDLAAHGVIYPGAGLNHTRGANALMGRVTPTLGRVDRKAWDKLTREIRAVPSARSWISYEGIVQSQREAAERFITELGDTTQVVITTRNYPSMYASAWQQWIKDGGNSPLTAWCETALEDEPRTGEGRGFQRRHDTAAIARLWAEIVGPDQVTVVVLDKRRPGLLFDAFETMLGLPSGFLASAPRTALTDNRSLTLAEAALLEEVNATVAPMSGPLGPVKYYRLVKGGVVATILRDRAPVAAEGRVALPADLAAQAAQRGERAAEDLRAVGVRVAGDLDQLGEAPRSSGPGPAGDPGLRGGLPEQLDPELAALAVTGAVSSAIGEGVNFDARRRAVAALGTEGAARSLGTRRIVRELARRAVVREGRS